MYLRHICYFKPQYTSLKIQTLVHTTAGIIIPHYDEPSSLIANLIPSPNEHLLPSLSRFSSWLIWIKFLEGRSSSYIWLLYSGVFNLEQLPPQLFCFFFFWLWHVAYGILWFSDQGSNPSPLHWKCRVLTAEPSGKSALPSNLSTPFAQKWAVVLWTGSHFVIFLLVSLLHRIAAGNCCLSWWQLPG